MPTEEGTARGGVARRTWFARVRGSALSVGLPFLVLLGICAFLELAKRAGKLPITIPAPSEIWLSLLNDADVLIYHLGPTAFAASAGFFASLVVALSLAGLTSIYRRLEAGIVSSGLVIDSIPLIALTPMLMLWLGKDTASRATIAAIAAFFPMLVGSVQGFKAVQRNADELFHVMAASPWQRFLKLSVPSALPYLFSAFKIAAPVAVLGALIAEWAGADRGLGTMMVYALFAFNPPQVWLTIIATCLMAIGGYGLIAGLERLVVHWDTGGTLDTDAEAR